MDNRMFGRAYTIGLGENNLSGSLVVRKDEKKAIAASVNIPIHGNDDIVEGRLKVRRHQSEQFIGRLVAASKNRMFGKVHTVGLGNSHIASTVIVRRSSKMDIEATLGIPSLDSATLFTGNLFLRQQCQKRVQSSMVIFPGNRMFGKVYGVGLGESVICSSLRIRRISQYSIKASIDIPRYETKAMLNSNIIVRQSGKGQITGILTILPTNRMYGKAEILERPITTLEFDAVKDTMIRSTLAYTNFGQDHSMVVGNIGGNIYRSYIAFNTPSIDLSDVDEMISIELKLSGFTVSAPLISIHEAASEWGEYSLMWHNKTGIASAYKKFTPVPGENYINIRDLVEAWWNGRSNKGITLKADNEQQEGKIASFNTKESSINRPKIVIKYYKKVKSGGVRRINSSVVVRQNSVINLPGSIKIISGHSRKIMSSSLVIKQYFRALEKRAQMVIVSHRDKILNGQLNIIQYDAVKEIEAYFVHRQVGEEWLNDNSLTIKKYTSMIELNSNFVYRDYAKARLENCSVSIPRYNDVKNLIGTLRVNGYHDLESSVQLSHKYAREYKLASIFIKGKKSIDSSMKIPVKQGTHVMCGTTFIRAYRYIPGTIRIKGRKFIQGKLDVIHIKNIESSLRVLSDNLGGKVIIRRSDSKVFEGTVVTRQRGEKVILSELYLKGGESIRSNLSIRGYKDKDILANVKVIQRRGYVFIM